MRWLLITLVLVLAGCTSDESSVTADPPDRPNILGYVLDPLFRPVADATITTATQNITVADDGRFSLHVNQTEILLIAQAPGHMPATRQITLDSPDQQVMVNLTLHPIVDDGYVRLEPLRGFITCGAIAQAGHSHGSGDPADDNHIDCEEVGGAHQNRWTIEAHDDDPTDMLFEVVWDANSEHSRYLTAVLYDDQGNVLAFAEGPNILRLELATLKVQQYFQGGREAQLLILPGIQEEQDPEVFVGVHFQQEFDVYFTTFYGMQMPIEYSVA